MDNHLEEPQLLQGKLLFFMSDKDDAQEGIELCLPNLHVLCWKFKKLNEMKRILFIFN